MQKEVATFRADVKCYFCGHVSGQVTGRRGQPIRPSSFVPRPGFTGELPGPGQRMRCERCNGPVFLEEVGSDELIGKPPAEVLSSTRKVTRKAA